MMLYSILNKDVFNIQFYFANDIYNKEEFNAAIKLKLSIRRGFIIKFNHSFLLK